jgi:hypothetical protein
MSLYLLKSCFAGEMCENNAKNQFTNQEFLKNVEKYFDGETS